ncbi:hypothetical protein [Bosea thiooxidans]|uniref:Uncharacterized protein n=1 Tax=Bosea thiooxidans TaxID=53254 RepID=A0A1T5GJV6_9HYPH|nr:hypothetical protein [Bosea thiooxidans]SKC08627.1 hypothetical protein SAMN05660750_04145 [Bosea thiooxidans]
MRRLLFAATYAIPLLLATGLTASAQPRFGGGSFHYGGGFRTHGLGAPGLGMRPMGMRPAFPAYRAGFRPGWQGGGWGRPGFYPNRPYWGGGYRPYWGAGYRPYRRYWGGYPYWGAAAGLATAATIGAIASYPSYYPDYPAYPVYPAYEVAPAGDGGQCATPVKVCTLYEPAPLGVGCSCRVPGGRARGTVVGP